MHDLYDWVCDDFCNGLLHGLRWVLHGILALLMIPGYGVVAMAFRNRLFFDTARNRRGAFSDLRILARVFTLKLLRQSG
jgi:hypothetical protein